MTAIAWDPLVNCEFALEGEYGLDEDYAAVLKFDSGKERVYLKNSFVPKAYPSLSLLLDNVDIISSGSENTEYKRFVYWHDVLLRYGSLPFCAPRIGHPGETATYIFIPGSLQFQDADGIITATFGLKEAF